MVFLGGPRQVGKTTLALALLGTEDRDPPAYLNWDTQRGRASILRHEIPAGQRLLVFNELHKFRKWRGFVKGLFDEYQKKNKSSSQVRLGWITIDAAAIPCRVDITTCACTHCPCMSSGQMPIKPISAGCLNMEDFQSRF